MQKAAKKSLRRCASRLRDGWKLATTTVRGLCMKPVKMQFAYLASTSGKLVSPRRQRSKSAESVPAVALGKRASLFFVFCRGALASAVHHVVCEKKSHHVALNFHWFKVVKATAHPKR